MESALEGEVTDHLGYDGHEAAGRDGGNSRSGEVQAHLAEACEGGIEGPA